MTGVQTCALPISESALVPPPARILGGQNTKEKCPFLFRRNWSRVNPKSKEHFSLVSAEALRGGGGADSFVQFSLEKGSCKVYNYSIMILVKVRVLKSPIEGLGLVAGQFIPKGTKTWEFTPEFDREFTPNQFKSFPRPIQEFLNTYAYISPKTGNYILPADDERFTNHSENPNTTSVEVEGEEDYDIAARDIEEGEEITTDYGLSAGKIDFEVK